MKILVTGSSGLIGSATSSILQDQGFDVVSMDVRHSQNSGKPPFFGNILDGDELSRATSGVEGVIHLAAVSRVMTAQTDPELCLRVNVDGLTILIEKLKQQPHPPWIIYASSREVYGEPRYLPVNEEHPLYPINVYGRSKKIAENLLAEAVKAGITSIIFRFSNVYGSVCDYPTRVIPAFLTRVIEGTPLRVDSPDLTFDFTHVKDVAAAIFRVVNGMVAGEFSGVDIFNLCPGKGTSLAELIVLLREISGKRITTMQGEPRNYDVTRYVGDCARIEARLGYHCQIQLKQGLELMYNDYQHCRSIVG